MWPPELAWVPGLVPMVSLSAPVGGSAAFIGASRLHVNEALLGSRNPEGEEMRGGCTVKFPTSLSALASASPPGTLLSSEGPPFPFFSLSFIHLTPTTP